MSGQRNGKRKGATEWKGEWKISKDQQWANMRLPQIVNTSRRGEGTFQRSSKMFTALENQEDKTEQGEQCSSFKPRIMKICCAMRLLLHSSTGVHVWYQQSTRIKRLVLIINAQLYFNGMLLQSSLPSKHWKEMQIWKEFQIILYLWWCGVNETRILVGESAQLTDSRICDKRIILSHRDGNSWPKQHPCKWGLWDFYVRNSNVDCLGLHLLEEPSPTCHPPRWVKVAAFRIRKYEWRISNWG